MQTRNKFAKIREIRVRPFLSVGGCFRFQAHRQVSASRLEISAATVKVMAVLEGRRIAPGLCRGRKVRTPQGATLRNLDYFGPGYTQAARFKTCRRTVPQKTNSRRRKPGVMVKRCGKSAPRAAQATRQGKPRRVQGQIGNRGAARSAFRESETGFGYRSLRQMILSVRKNADRIRLTALPKPTSSGLAEPGFWFYRQ